MTDQRRPVTSLPRFGAHMPALDGIRGIAVLLVMVCHFVLYGGMKPRTVTETVISRLALSGWIGVDLFFVLSGFLITGILFDAKGSRSYFRNFYMRRFLRIFPLYYVFLIFFFFGIPTLLDLPERFTGVQQDQIWYWTYLTNVRVALHGWPALAGSIGHFWSLAVEEQFYIVWPAVVFLCSRKSLVRICLACIAGSWLLRTLLALSGNELAAYVLTPTRLDALAVGGLLALVGRDRQGLETLHRYALPVAFMTASAALLVLALRGGFGSEDPVMQIFGYSTMAYFFGAIIVLAIVSRGRLGRWLSHPVLRFFGRYSYAIYVFHLPLARFIEARVFSVSDLPAVWDSQLPGQVLFFLLAATASTGLAVLSWHLFESRVLSLKRYFPYGRTSTGIAKDGSPEPVFSFRN